jgi:osmotically inducible protein OsmC
LPGAVERAVDLIGVHCGPLSAAATDRPGSRNPSRGRGLLDGMHVPEDIARTAAVKWDGDVAKGHGTITTGSGKVSADYSFGTRFSGEPGTNPEELLAASYAACFTMALSATLTRAGHPPTLLETTAKVHLKRAGAGFDITAIELTTHATVGGLLDDEFQHLAQQAKESCPIGKALHVIPTTLNASRKT